MCGFCLVAVDAGFAPLGNCVLAGVCLRQGLPLVYVDDLKLVELIVPESHAVVESEPSDLADLFSEMLGNGVASVETYLFFARIVSEIFGANGETVAVVDDYFVGDEMMRGEHFQRIKWFGLF